MTVEELKAALRVAELKQQLAAAEAAAAAAVQTTASAAAGKKENKKTKSAETKEAAAVVQTTASVAKKVSTVKCNYGKSCNNKNCKFKHPDGARESTEESKEFVPKVLCSYFADCESHKNRSFKCTFKHVDPSEFLPEDVGDEEAFVQVVNHLKEGGHYQDKPADLATVRDAICQDQMTDEKFGNWLRFCHGNRVWVRNGQINIKGYAPGKKRAVDEEKTDADESA